MSVPNDCGCPKPNEQTESVLSRREFLQVSGVATAGVMLAALPPNLINPPNFAPAGTVEDALKIALPDAMFLEMEEEVKALGMALNLDAASIKLSGTQDALTGFVLTHSQSPSKRMGADLALTVDVGRGLVTSVQLVVGWSEVDMLNLAHITLDYRDVPEPLYPTRANTGAPPEMLRPRSEAYFYFPRINSPAYQPEDLVESGWPPHAEDPAAGYWHYGNTAQAGWMLELGEYVYRCNEAKETQNVTEELFINLPISGK